MVVVSPGRQGPFQQAGLTFPARPIEPKTAVAIIGGLPLSLHSLARIPSRRVTLPIAGGVFVVQVQAGPQLGELRPAFPLDLE